MTLDDAEAFAVSQGWAKFRGEQVWRWVHAHGARSFEEMSNLNRQPRARLAEVATIGTLPIAVPLHNYDNLIKSLRTLTHDKCAKLAQRRVTVSTSGLVPKLERLGHETVRPNLAVSLNAANDETRDEIMPINRKWNIAKLMAAL